LAKDKDGLLQKVMMETVDGEYQNFKANDGAYVRKHFFGKHPKLLEMVSRMSDEDIWRLNRGGHDPHKIYSAFSRASSHKGQPTVILVKTIKGYGMGKVAEGKNTAHQTKKLDDLTIHEFRDRFGIPIPEEKLQEIPFFKPSPESPEMKYLHERRKALGGYLPHRLSKSTESLKVPGLTEVFSPVLEPTAEGREISTTQAYVRCLTQLLRDKELGPRLVPILVDEARTFGMEGLFRQIGIYSVEPQKYEPVDRDQVMYYREDIKGQILQEGINEAGGMSSWIAAATSYSTNDRIMIPFYTYYSMFGLQRVGDLAWAAGDMRARGFLMGGTAGRTTLNGEGLQHEDGHSHILASVIPNCVAYDPTFAHEVAVIIHSGLKRMVAEQEDVFFYITIMNENYAHPGLKPGSEADLLRGMYLLQEGDKKAKLRVQLLGSGTILREVIAAAELLQSDFGVTADIWSCPSFTELRRDGMECERFNLLNPSAKPKIPFVAQQLSSHEGPVVAATDYMRLFSDQIRPYMPDGRRYIALGTDGFGRSDTRAKLREFFEVDRRYVAVAALRGLADDGKIKMSAVGDAIKKYGIDANRPSPMSV
jgi:pyruvate dehydrogenase E1 component